MSIEYLKLPEQYAFASCLPGTVTEWMFLSLYFIFEIRYWCWVYHAIIISAETDAKWSSYIYVSSSYFHASLWPPSKEAFTFFGYLQNNVASWLSTKVVVVSLPLWQPQLLHPNISILHTSIRFILFHLFLYTEVSFTKKGLQDTLLAKTILDTLGMNCINSIPIIF